MHPASVGPITALFSACAETGGKALPCWQHKFSSDYRSSAVGRISMGERLVTTRAVGIHFYADHSGCTV
jgi:hypothetical protein